MEISYTTKYLRLFRKLPKAISEKVSERERIFRENPFDPRLETHKLKADQSPHWAFSVDKKNRVKFIPLGEGMVEFVFVGPHNEAYKKH